MTKIYFRHIRKSGLCSRGLRKFAEDNGLDWQSFLREGIDVEQAKLIDDAMVKTVIRIAEEEDDGK